MTFERTTAVGFGSSVARIGGLLAPQVLYLGTINQLLPGKFSFLQLTRYFSFKYFA